MKRSTLKLILIIFAVFTAVAPVFAENAKITYIRGKVEVSHDDSASWVPLKVGDLISSNDVISTGFQSEAKVEIGGSIMSLGAVTRITLEKLTTSSTKDNVSLYLKTGAVRSKVTHPDEKRVSYSVKTPIAVASVRGTDFTITAAGHVTCNEGAVAVYANTENRISGRRAEASEESEEESSETASESDNADNGPANSTTPADEIYSEAPAGAVVVAKNQEVSIKSNGNPETPMVNVQKKNDKVRNTVTTAAAQEAVAVGGTAVAAVVTVVNQETPVVVVTTPVEEPSVVEQPEDKPSPSGLSVNIKLED